MSKASVDQLRWFWKHADMFLSDSEASPNHNSPAFFWDTSDVQGALLGFTDFYGQDGEFLSHSFDSGMTLVRSLMASGWFGRIFVTLPHQEEVITQISNLLKYGPKRIPPGGVERFLQQALLKYELKSAPDGLGTAQIRRLIKTQLAAAGDLFKAIQCIVPWKDRLHEWKDNRLLLFQVEDKFDYETALATRQFSEIQAALSIERPEVPINNFTDAMALCNLNFILRESLSQGKALPLFFASDVAIRRAADQVSDSTFLRYQSKNGEYVSILRDSDYYFIRASLWPPDTFRSTIHEEPIELLRSMRDEIRDNLKVQSHNDLSSSGELLELRESLSETIEQLRRFWFLQRVWLPSAAEREFDFRVERYLKDTRRLIDEERRDELIRKDIEAVRKQIDQGARAYARVYALWDSMYDAVKACHDRFHSTSPAPSVDKSFGLVRFGFTQDLISKVQESFEQIISSSKGDLRSVGDRLATATYAYIYGKGNPDIELDRLAALLWVLKLDRSLAQIPQKAQQSDEINVIVPLQIMQGAAILRMGRQPSAIVNVSLGLSKQLDHVSQPQKRSQIMSGLAYLSFHAWLNGGGRPFWHPEGPSGIKGGVQIISANLSEAITWARRAMEVAPSGSANFAYALNQYVYYVTEGGTLEEFRNVDKERELLMALQRDQSIWQYRFDDTLARYFHRLALTTDESDRPGLWSRAEWHINEASRFAFGDEEIERYKGILVAGKARASGSKTC
jgi:hypothetical protein